MLVVAVSRYCHWYIISVFEFLIYIRSFYFFVDDVLCSLPNRVLVFFCLLDGMKLVELRKR